jgi:hypothetical protein
MFQDRGVPGVLSMQSPCFVQCMDSNIASTGLG